MKIKFCYIIAVLFLTTSGCSKDDSVSVRAITPSNIQFVNEDGSAIAAGECINPTGRYAISITTISSGNGGYEPTKIDYTVNGISHSMTFLREGLQKNPVQLINGVNIFQLVDTGKKIEISYFTQDDFQLVD